MDRDTPITFEGVDYPSITAMAEALDVVYNTAARWIARGSRPPDSTLRRPKPVTFEGVDYRSITAMAAALDVTHGTAHRWALAGQRAKYNGRLVRPVTFEGVTYQSFAALAEALGVSSGTARRWVAHGRGGVRGRRKPIGRPQGSGHRSVKAVKRPDGSWYVYIGRGIHADLGSPTRIDLRLAMRRRGVNIVAHDEGSHAVTRGDQGMPRVSVSNAVAELLGFVDHGVYKATVTDTPGGTANWPDRTWYATVHLPEHRAPRCDESTQDATKEETP